MRPSCWASPCFLLRQTTAANNLESEKAGLLRDQIHELKRQFGQTSGPAKALAEKATMAVSYRKGKKRK